jgi:putative addiction module component (TIGR02574 family)
MSATSEVLNAALTLKPDERAELAHKLLLSLEPADFDPNADQAWADEVRRRLQAIREGKVALRDWDEALSDTRQSIVSKDQA